MGIAVPVTVTYSNELMDDEERMLLLDRIRRTAGRSG